MLVGVIGANDEGVGVLARADVEDRQAAALVGDDRLQLVGVGLAVAGRLRLVVVAEARPDVLGDQVDLAVLERRLADGACADIEDRVRR